MAGNMIKLRATITLALLICSTAWATESARIDRTFTAKGDLKGTGSQQLLTLRVQGTSINAPFIWSVSIYDRGGALIYHYKSDDALIDKLRLAAELCKISDLKLCLSELEKIQGESVLQLRRIVEQSIINYNMTELLAVLNRSDKAA